MKFLIKLYSYSFELYNIQLIDLNRYNIGVKFKSSIIEINSQNCFSFIFTYFRIYNLIEIKTKFKNLIKMQFFKNLFSKNNENTKLIDIFEKNEYLKPICDEIKKIGFSKLYDYTIKIIKQLVSKSLNLQKLLKRIKQGLPDEIPSLRSLVWKIILLYLPREIDQWNDSLEKSRNKYFELRKEVYDNLIKNEKIFSVELDSFNISIPLQRYKSEQISLKNNEELDIEIFREVDKNYHFSNNKIYLKLYSFMKTHSNEISVNSKKAIQSYLQDCEILNQINKDIRRTKINMHFLFTPSIGNSSLNNDNISKIVIKNTVL